ncbi:DMSO/TMAO reductase YedYZ molybdopterin-dependent catalytic subunit [Frondihabitans sp. PhB188]|uniref:molybdopterin-dependent oxidoreductase n=1 Tax=Frondihabitans sp. PhB188 TaxID=2485200 RepID=UPI000F49A36D|nr:molybdopterin-dependent oxidoreductase [Frondihabitans sp. PhB188]ROQ38576.1 DMSO/TMAO reductase YedYZ molybdopterin-dependent catalytic subunit [Frondihabitans sp. PhB188]
MRELMYGLRRSMTSPNRNARTAVAVGRLLGLAFLICLLTGLYSHFLQEPASWMRFPTRPVSLYRWTQGIHITAGIACFPLLFAKLYAVFPQLFQWPPIKTPLQVLERASIALFVAASLVQIFTGLLNTFQYYPWPFPFKQVHYALAYVIIGSLAVHIGVKLPVIQRYWRARDSYDENGDFIPLADDIVPPSRGHVARERLAALDYDADALRDPDVVFPAEISSAVVESRPPRGFVGRIFDWIDRTPEVEKKTSRRGFIAAVGGTTVGLVALTGGQSITALGPINVFAPRKNGIGPNDLPVNRTAKAAQVLETATDPSWVLTLMRNGEATTFSLDDLEAMPQSAESLPISCVEGWSQMGHWTGVRLRDLVAAVGATETESLRITSLEKKGGYRVTLMGREYVNDPTTLVALQLNGKRLDIDHGYPARMIAPGRPGVLQTKWLSSIEVIA